MPIYKIEGPDGRIHEIEGPAGASDAQLIAVLKQHMASQPKPPEDTLIGSALRGGKSMLGSEQTGIASLFDANKAALEGLERQKKIAQEHPSEDSWERVKKAYNEKGLGSAVAEYARQVPYAIAEQTPQIAQSMAGAAAGAATPVPGGSLIGAFVPSFTQQYGGFLESQAREQQARGEPVDVSRFKAAAAAVPAAAIDVAQTLIPMGKGLIKSIFGPNVEKLLARGATEEAEKLARSKLSQEGFLKTLGKGTVRGAALETPGEVIQQMLDRAQAGQSLFDDDALADYGRTAFQTTQLGPLGAVGRFQDKSAARTQVDLEGRAEAAKKAQEAQVEQQRLAAEEAAKQAAYRQTPEYLTEIQQRYNDLQNSAKDIRARMNAKVEAGDLAGETDRNNARAEYKALRGNEEARNTVNEYLAARKRIDEQNAGVADAKAREEAGKVPGAQMDLFGGMPATTDRSPVGQLRTLDSQVKGIDAQIAEAKKAGDQTQIQALTNQQFDLQKEMQRLAPAPADYAAMEGTINRQIEDLRTKMGSTAETAELERYVNLIKEQKDSLKKLEELKPFVSEKPKTTDVTSREAELQGLKKKIASFQELGDDEAIGRLLPRVKELEAEPTLMEGEQFRNTPTDDLFAAEIDDGAREARETRESVEAEIEKLRGMTERVKRTGPVAQAYHDRELAKARSLLSLFEDSEQDWDKLKKDPANTEYRDDRDKLKVTLEKDIKELENQSVPEGTVLPTRQTFELGVKRKALKNLNRRMEAADRFKNTTPLAGNIIAERTDENISSLLDFYLPKIKPAQEGFDVQNDRAAMAKQAKELRAKIHDNLIDLYDAVKAKEATEQRKSTNTFLFNADRLVNINRLLNNGKALEREAKTGLREQLLNVTDDIQKTVSNLELAKEQLRKLDGEIKDLGQPTSPEQAEVLGAMEKRRDTLAVELKKLQAKTGWEDKADAIVERYSQVIPEDKQIGRAGRVLPIEKVESNAERIDAIIRELRLINEKVQKAGRPTEEDKLTALADLKDRRKDLGKELQKLRGAKPSIEEANKQVKEVTPEMAEMQRQLATIEGQLKNLTVESSKGNIRAQLEKARDELKAKIETGVQEEAAPVVAQKELPGVQPKRLAPTLQEITPEKLTEARTAFVAAETKVEELKKAVRNTQALQDNPQYFSEVAKRLRDEVDTYKKEYAQTSDNLILQRLESEYTARDQTARYFDLLADLAEQGQADLKTVQKELAQAIKDLPKAEAAFRDLERRQRMQQQQQAAVKGETPGRVEAERIQAGESREFRSPSGKTLTKPKKAESWDIKKQSVAPVAKVPELTKARALLARAKELVRMASMESASSRARLVASGITKEVSQLQGMVSALEPQIKGAFSEEKAKELATELAQIEAVLQERGSAKQKAPSKVEKQYKNQPKDFAASIDFAEKDASSEYKAAKKASDAAQDAYEAARKAIDDMPPMASGLEFGRLDAAMSRAGAAYEKLLPKTQTAELDYLAARRDSLIYNQLVGEELRQTFADFSGKLANALNRESPLVKQVEDAKAAEAQAKKALEEAQAKARDEEAKMQAEKNAGFADKQKALDAAKAEKERLEKAKSGAGYDTRRFTRDTSNPLMTAELNRLKRELATADTNLGKAKEKNNAEDIKKYQEDYNRIESNIDTLYSVAPIVERDVEQTAGPQPDIEEGMRLPNRKEGPVVRNLTGAKRVRQSGIAKLRADGLSHEAANAVHLFTVKARLDGATPNSQAKLEAAYKEATDGLTEEQIANQLAEGERLLGSGKTIEIIAARERYRQAVIDVEKAQKDYNEAKTPATKELAKDALDLANERSDSAETAYKNVRDVQASRSLKGGAQQEVEAALDAATAKQEAATLPEIEEEGPIQGAATQYSEVEQVQLSDVAKEALADGRLLDAVNDVAENGNSDFIRQNAKNVVNMLLRTKVVIDPELVDGFGNPVPAFYDNVTNTVKFRPGEQTEENLIHEVTHAASLRALVMPATDLTKEQLAARNELNAMFNQLKKDKALVDEYGLTNVAEFASEVQSNKDFRDRINQKPWFGGNMLSRFFQALLRMVGFKTGQLTTDVATKNIEALYMPSQKFQMVDQLGAASVFRTKAPAINSVIVGQEAGKGESLKGNLFGLGGRVQLVDRLAAADAAIVAGEGAGKLTSAEAFQAQYFMRLADTTTQAAGQFITHGPVSIVADKTAFGTEYRYASSKGPSLVDMSEHLEDASKAGLGADAERILTVQIAGERAEATPNGWARLLSSDPAAAKAEYLRDKATLAANPEAKKSIDAAKAVYKQYNNGLIDFIVQCGFISKKEGDRLKQTPFIPFYRVENGEVKLFTDKEHAIRIGNIKENPDLQRMLGDEKTILPILTSAVQNTFMLTRSGMKNLATHKTSDALYKSGFASKIGKGSGPTGSDVVRFKVDGEDHFAVIDSDTFGIPAHLIVKGMEGIKTTIPEIVRMMGIPANWIRKFVTRSPAYAIRQLIRDPVNAAIVGGVDGVPVVNALKQLAKMRAGRSPAEDALMRGLAISSNVYTGDEQDMQKFLQDISTGKGKWDKMMGMLDTVALQADAATRATIYEDSIKKGFTEAQAQFRAFESQNFSRRGLSPSIQALNMMIPFFNAQIQGLDVLYRSFKGNMPFSERLEIQRKIKARGMMLMAGTIAYALMMEDDDDYRKLPPEVKYGNWFVHIPGVKDPLRIPIPYEVGILFKALPEAIMDVARRDTKAKEAIKGLGMLLWQSAPGAVPVAGKPVIEAAIGATPYGPIETSREKELPAAMRYRPETTEVAKTLGSFTGAVGVSPLMIEHFVRSYTSSLGLSALHMLDPVLRSSTEGAKASTSASKLPFVGGLFQSADGRFLIDRAYERMDEVVQAQKGYEDLASRGKKAEAKAWAQEYASLLAQADMAGSFKKDMGELFTDERTIRADSRLSTEQKDKLIARIKAQQNREAEAFYRATERRKPQ